jgi:hypothetical protein
MGGGKSIAKRRKLIAGRKEVGAKGGKALFMDTK